ncbi:hypothetical protein [Staphylococcus schleiferi]|uniref:hypothetical protein n=1 Tax=Staphylococcus schleiferi TaxID=1295 RepID=UPI00248085D5|nr:hypothetical protein [Staphylococcus schleiferi]
MISLYQTRNALISYQLNESTNFQLASLNQQLLNERYQEQRFLDMIQAVFQTHYETSNITIGVSDDRQLRENAYQFKDLLEQALMHTGCSEFVIRVVEWKEDCKSMKKFERAFVENEPDIWFVFSKPLSFCRLLKRLYRNPLFDPRRTYCMSNLCSNHLVQTLGFKYFEGMKGITSMGKVWTAEDGELRIIPS